MKELSIKKKTLKNLWKYEGETGLGWGASFNWYSARDKYASR